MDFIKKKKAITIAFEGGEGSGKGTSIKKLLKYLDNHNFNVLKVREPGGLDISESIRDIILDKDNTNMTALTESLLYAASRSQLLNDIKLEFYDRDIIIFDRSIYSSFAYQGYARGLGFYNVLDINKQIPDYIDIVIYLDLKPDIGINRIKNHRQDEINRLDLEKLEFHNKVREGYKILSNKFDDKFITINANQKEEDVFNDIIEALKEKKHIFKL